MQYNQSYKSHTVSRVGFFRIYSLFNYLFDLCTCWQLETLELFSKRKFRSVLPTHQILELRSSYLQRYSLYKLHGEIRWVAKIGTVNRGNFERPGNFEHQQKSNINLSKLLFLHVSRQAGLLWTIVCIFECAIMIVSTAVASGGRCLLF